MSGRLALVVAAGCAFVLAGALAGLSADLDGVSAHVVEPSGVVPGPTVDVNRVGAEARDPGETARPAEWPEGPARRPEVPVRNGFIGELEPDRGPAPVRLHVGTLSIDAPIEPVGYDAEAEAMEVPRSADVVGWYRFGPLPGEQGSSVLAGHVDWNGRGVFFDLYLLEVGTVMTVDYDDGSKRRFEVVASRQYRKERLPIDDLFRRDGEPVLALITCGGSFDRATRSYTENVVVYARPFDSWKRSASAA